MLTASHNVITEEEIVAAINEYAAFVKSFDSRLAADPMLSYAVVPADANLSNLDRWYERSEGEKSGEFVIYRLALRLSR